MKKLFSVLMVFALPALMVACAKKGSDNDATGTGLTTTCVSGTCQTSMYNTYNAIGFAAYPTPTSSYNTISGNTTAFCGCHWAYSRHYTMKTVYHNQWGLGCALTSVVNTVPNAGQFYLSAAQQWNSTTALGTVQITSNYVRYTCDQSVAQACLITESNPCSSGQTCRAVGGSQIGICGN